jgi:hypothetical protein
LGKTAATPQDVIDAIRAAAQTLGRPPSRSAFLAHSGMTERQVQNHFNSWNEAVKAAGLEPNTKNARIDDSALLEDWGQVVRDLREIPTFVRYRREGNYSSEVFQTRFGAWSKMPEIFREFAANNPEWADVVALLPMPTTTRSLANPVGTPDDHGLPELPTVVRARHSKLTDRPTYGNPIDFRGLRHEPVNEQGVVFLFGMVAKELGYMVEAVQGAYPDCEAKRQIGPNNWQRVRIEFEFESRNFRDHGHPCEGCDVIVCWRHNWLDCPPSLEVVELASIIKTLSKSED